jgi:NADPH2:quinone reductase
MKAYVIRQFGDPSVFEKADVATPQPYPGQVLIEVKATSVNPLDCKIRQGKLAAIAPEFPAVLHGDVSGVIREMGDKVAGFNIGDEVYACAGGVIGTGGALAQYILADADLVARKPKNISHREAAALPLVSITAWTALMDKAQVKPGQTVLIYGGTGGVGHIGIQLAKAAGATVYATCSSDSKSAIVKDFGADYTINYRDMDVDSYINKYTEGKGFEVVFDTVGGENLQNAFRAAAVNGTVACVSTRTTQDLSLMHSKGLTLHVVFMLIPLLHNTGRAHHGDILTQIARLVEQSRLHVLLDDSNFKMADVAKAHARLEAGENTGKIVLEA